MAAQPLMAVCDSICAWLLRRHAIRADMPNWLKEIILRCLEPKAAQGYANAAELGFDLSNLKQVPISRRGMRLHGMPLRSKLRR